MRSITNLVRFANSDQSKLNLKIKLMETCQDSSKLVETGRDRSRLVETVETGQALVTFQTTPRPSRNATDLLSKVETNVKYS